MSGDSTKLSDTREKQCSHCGAVLPAESPVCWLCFAPVESTAGGSGVAKQIAKPKHDESALQGETAAGFSLASLLMVVTLVAVVLGMFTVGPGLGVVGAIVLLPALLRTASEIQRRKRRGQAATFAEKPVVFAASLGMVGVAGVAAAIAFYVACWAGFFASEATGIYLPIGGVGWVELYTGIVVGVLCGGIVGVWVFYRLAKAFASKDVRKRPS